MRIILEPYSHFAHRKVVA